MTRHIAPSGQPTHRMPTGTAPPDPARARRVGRPHGPREQTQPSARGQRDEAEERQQREERILDAAAALLVRWGYRKTTVDDVAREAGVGKGTIYLHWKDKNTLFRAAIMRANQLTSEDVLRRIAADPEGGLPHRQWMHAMLASLANPLMAAIMKGQSDIFQGLIGALDQYIVHLRAPG
jgi:AcrR family transcriptional regulator